MTGFILPTSTTAPIGQWTLQDWGAPAATSSKAGADGIARAQFEALDVDVQWLVDRAVVTCNSGAITTLRLYDTEVLPGRLLSGSAAGNFDEAEYPSGLLIRPQSALVAVWTGCDPGAVGTIRLQTRVMRKPG